MGVSFACYDYERDYYRPLIDAFHEANPDVRVHLVSLGAPDPVGSTELMTTLSAAADTFIGSSLLLHSGSPPTTPRNLATLAEEDPTFDPDDFYTGALSALQSLPALAPTEEEPSVQDGGDRGPTQESGSGGPALWGIPLTLNPRVIFYNRARFEDAGLPEPRPGWTWDQFLASAQALTRRHDGNVTRYGYVDAAPYYSLPALAYQRAPLSHVAWAMENASAQQGVWAFIDIEGQPEIDLATPQTAEALSWYADLVREHEVMRDPTDEAWLTSYEIAPSMWAGTVFELDTFRARYGDVGVAPFPERGLAATDLVVRGAFIHADAPHPEAAWRWIVFLSYQPPGPHNDSLPARKSVAESSGFWDDLDLELATTYRYVLSRVIWFPRPIYDALGEAYGAILTGTAPEDALSEAQAAHADAISATFGTSAPASAVD